MIMNKKGITPIISVILLLMMSVAVAGIAWFWLQSMTQKVMSQTETGTTTQLETLKSSLIVQASSCDTSDKNATFVLYNPGSSSVVVTGAVVGTQVSSSGGDTITSGSAKAVSFNFAAAPTSGATATINSQTGSITTAVGTCVA